MVGWIKLLMMKSSGSSWMNYHWTPDSIMSFMRSLLLTARMYAKNGHCVPPVIWFLFAWRIHRYHTEGLIPNIQAQWILDVSVEHATCLFIDGLAASFYMLKQKMLV